jgi:hypothetical protein
MVFITWLKNPLIEQVMAADRFVSTDLNER